MTAHSALSGLSADDHPQYLTNARGDARYYTKSQSDASITNAVAANSTSDRARGNHTGEQSQSSVTGLVASLTNRIQSVLVSTGSEPRPTGSTMVLWVGGSSQPVNMATGDVWLAAEGADPGDDISAPSIPTGVGVSGLYATGGTVSWSPSTDNVAVTGYEVWLDGVAFDTTATPSYLFNALTAETDYTVRVRARDAAGNWSALSTSVAFTTPPVGEGVRHSVFGATAHPGTLVVATGNPMTAATAFYTFSSSANGWNCVGGRLYVPAAASVPSTCTVSLWTGSTGDLSVTPARTASMTGITAGQWNEVEWSSPIGLTPGQPVWIGYHFSDGRVLVTDAVTSDPIQSGTTAFLYEAQATEFGGGRSRELLDSGGSSMASTAHYAIDIIVEEA